MPQLTARDIHFVHAQVRREESALASLPDWDDLFGEEQAMYERMAALLNEKLAPPKQAQLLSEKEKEKEGN